jgi:hypothetical protein
MGSLFSPRSLDPEAKHERMTERRIQGYVDQCIINQNRLLGSSDREPLSVSTRDHAEHRRQPDSLEVDVFTGEGSVDGREGVELVFKQVLVLGVKEAGTSVCGLRLAGDSRNALAPFLHKTDSHSGQLSTILGNSCPLANNLGRPDHLLEDLLVDGGEGSRTGSLL